MASSETRLAADYGTLSDLVRAHAIERPTHIAVVDGERRIDYGRLDELVDRCAAALQRDGLYSGDRVAILGDASIRYLIVLLAILRAGGVAAPLAPSSTLPALAAMLSDAAPTHLFADAAIGDALARSLGGPIRVDLDTAVFDDWIAPAGAQPCWVETSPEEP